MALPELLVAMGRLLGAAVGVYVALLMLTRLAGLRSFSQMATFDFAVTVATGTVVASTILTPQLPFWKGLAALAGLFALQVLVGHARRSPAFERLVDNTPRLLMAGSDVLEDNLRKARVTRKDLDAKLRQEGIQNYSQVGAVVFERTGVVSVLRNDEPIDPTLLDGVLGAERLRARA